MMPSLQVLEDLNVSISYHVGLEFLSIIEDSDVLKHAKKRMFLS